MLNQLDVVVLNVDLPEDGLKAGEVGTIVHIYGGEAHIVEVMTLEDRTISIADAGGNRIRAVSQKDKKQARPMESEAYRRALNQTYGRTHQGGVANGCL